MKGVSPLIASVLLVAFTVSVALIYSGWLSSFAKGTSENVSLQSLSAVECSTANAKIYSIYLENSTSNSSAIIVNEGGVDLQLRAVLIVDNGSLVNSTPIPVPKGSSVSIQIPNSSINCGRISKASITSNCPGCSYDLPNKNSIYYKGRPCSLCDTYWKDLVLNLKLDENSGILARDYSPYGNNATLNGSTWTTGKTNYGIYSKGSLENRFDCLRINDSSSLDIGDEFTISFWFKPDSSGSSYTYGGAALYSGNNSLIQGILDKGSYNVFFDNDGRIKASSSKSGDWQLSYNGSNQVKALATYRGNLYAGTGLGTSRIYKFDGNSWSLNYTGAYFGVDSLAVFKDKIYAGNCYDSDCSICESSGSGWTDRDCGGAASIEALSISYSLLNPWGDLTLEAGRENMGFGQVLYSDDGVGWVVGSDLTEDAIYSLTPYIGVMYATQGYGSGDGDIFYSPDGDGYFVLNYDGSASSLHSLGVYDGNLYADNGSTIMYYNSSVWQTAYSTGKSANWAMAVYNGKLYVGADEDILVFNGTDWEVSYDKASGKVYSLAVYDGKLYAGDENGDIFVLDSGKEVSTSTADWKGGYSLITVTKDSSSLKIYVNGTLESSVSFSGTPEPNNKELLIGKLYGSRHAGIGDSTFFGGIDEVRIYNKTLSSSEVAGFYTETSEQRDLMAMYEEMCGS